MPPRRPGGRVRTRDGSPRARASHGPARVLLFHKPFRVLCQFSDRAGRATLADYVRVPDVYPAGRLDYDSEGLVVLTAVGTLQRRIADPRHRLPKTYWVQVEGVPEAAALRALARCVELADGVTLPARARAIAEPAVGPRHPPIRERRHIPTSLIEITLREGRNRQVRRMTAAVGLPTLRLIRVRVGPWELGGLAAGEWRAAPAASLVQAPAAGNSVRKQ